MKRKTKNGVNMSKPEAKEILDALKDEKICTSLETDPLFNHKLNKIRKVTAREASKMPGPGLTACVATTLLKVALCQELAQRFALEYCIRYKKQDISLIFLQNVKNVGENHTIVYMGLPKAPKHLFLGSGNHDLTFDMNAGQGLQEFLNNNKSGILVDPLLQCLGDSEDELKPLLQFCEERAVTHVVGIRSYHTALMLVDNAPIIKKNAVGIAALLKPVLDTAWKLMLTNPDDLKNKIKPKKPLSEEIKALIVSKSKLNPLTLYQDAIVHFKEKIIYLHKKNLSRH